MTANFEDWRLGQAIENAFGCLNEHTALRLGVRPPAVADYEGGKPFCLFQLSDPDAIKARIEAAMKCESMPLPPLRKGRGQTVTR